MVHRSSAAVALAALFALLLVAPAASAELSVTVDTSQGFNIYVDGAATLNAPRNLTIAAGTHGSYALAWDPPTSLPGQALTGYVIYRVPGPNTGGRTFAVHVGPNMDSAQDSWARADGTYVYFVSAVYGSSESVPSLPVSSADVTSGSPHCGVVSIYTSPPYYSVQLDCLFTSG